ncbi:MAG TPA: T9SS type A sorting domain-containing protein [Chitinophagaceae bacterium]|nr:T9SS type A sorting domain-containing protein [Chitinophagaceae bacterium]
MYKKVLIDAYNSSIGRIIMPIINSKIECRKILLLLFLAILSSNYLLAQADPSSVPTNALKLETDKMDYQPGETANISGSGFQPFEVVSLEVHHADGTPDSGEDHEPWTVNADANGNITTTWHVCEDDCLGSLLKLSAQGQSSGLKTSKLFTDATVTTLVFNNTAQGWFSTVSGQYHYSSNDNYIVGYDHNGFRNFFTFSLSGLNLSGKKVISAKLYILDNGCTPYVTTVTYSLFDVSASRSELTADYMNTNPLGQTIWNDLGSGQSYGSFIQNTQATGGSRVFELNTTALADIKTHSGGEFSIGGVLQSAPNNTFLFGCTGGTTGQQQLVIQITDENSITTSQLSSNSLCVGSSLSIPYTASGTFNASNTFTAQLSNAAGSFTSPTNIGSISSSTSGTINVTIPIGTPKGTGYRIRVVSDNPAITGSDNGSDITINSLPTASISAGGPTTFCPGGSLTLTSSVGDSYLWSTGETTQSISVNSSGNYTVTVTTNGCSATSAATTVTVEDNTKPTVVTKNITVQLDANGNATIAEDAVNNGSSDACGGLTFDTDKTTFNCGNVGANTVTLTVRDANGNSETGTATVTVKDEVKPVATCKNIEVYLGQDGTVSITPQQVNNGSSDACGITLSLDKTSFNTTNVGANTVTLTVKDPSNNSSSCQATITVKKRPTILVYTGDGSEQYSDKQALTAELRDQITNTVLSSKSVGFTIGSQSTSASTNASGIASANLILTQDPALVYTVASSFAGDDIYQLSSDSDPFDITREDARAYYTGALFASTSGANSNTATVTLSATIKDITAVIGDAAYDAFAGDIRNATVSFIDRDLNTVLATVPIGLVSSGDVLVGTATANVSLSTGSGDSKQFTIGIRVNNYYTRDAGDENTVVTVSKPLNDFVTGGGYLNLQRSGGQKAGTTGTKNNFGFNIKYNKSGTNLQGNINTIFRRIESDGLLHVYQIKGNAMTSLSTNTSNAAAKTAVFNGKANMQDITNPLAPVSMGGNLTLQVVMTDKGEPGNTDMIGITVWSGDGGMLYSSNWDGTRTVEQVLGGGNLKVTGGSFSSSPSTAPSVVQKESLKEQVGDNAPARLQLKTFPNPATDQFTVVVSSNNANEKISIRVMDLHGKILEVRNNVSAGQTLRIGDKLRPGTYYVEALQGKQKQALKVIKLAD